jgi:hypothetical protein
MFARTFGSGIARAIAALGSITGMHAAQESRPSREQAATTRVRVTARVREIDGFGQAIIPGSPKCDIQVQYG